MFWWNNVFHKVEEYKHTLDGGTNIYAITCLSNKQ